MLTTDAARDLVLTTFRRRGANRVHCALVMPDTIFSATYLGVACEVIHGPVVAWCGRTIRGDKFVIPAEHLDGWKRNGHVCRECQTVGTVTLAMAENSHSETPE